MPSREILDAFIDRVVSGAHVQAIEEFYWPDASMRENFSAPRVGRENLVAHERAALARAQSVESTCVGPVFVEGDHVVVRWRFVFTGHDGLQTRIEELAYQRWRGDRIAEETFFYDPAQLRPRPAGQS